MEVSLKSNIKEFTKQLDHIQKQQVPYATSRALNDVAVDAQESVVAAIPNVFNNRKKWWLKQQPTGVKVRFSKKTDLKASVYSKAYFAEMQEKGGTKTPRASRNLAIPTDSVPKKYRTSHGAKEMLNERQNVFKTPKGIFRRTGKKGAVLLWSYSRSAKVPRRFGFNDIVAKVVKRRFEQHFKKWLEKSISSMKTSK